MFSDAEATTAKVIQRYEVKKKKDKKKERKV